MTHGPHWACLLVGVGAEGRSGQLVEAGTKGHSVRAPGWRLGSGPLVRRLRSQLPSYKGQGHSGTLKQASDGERRRALLQSVPFPSHTTLCPNPQHWGHLQAPSPAAVPSLTSTSSGRSPRGGPSCSSRCGRASQGGRKGRLTPSLLHHLQMMKPRQILARVWVASKDAYLGATLHTHPSINWPIQSPRPIKVKCPFKGKYQRHLPTPH